MKTADRTRRLALMAMLAAIGVLSAHLVAMPVGPARVFPVQHALNVVAGVKLGPWPAVTVAFAVGVLRNILGTGTLLAFPGGMVGALLAGWCYRRRKDPRWAVAGEVLGTGLGGALLAYPVATLLMGREVALLFFVVPFALSSLTGAAVAYLVLRVLGDRHM
ncbi:MAG TPA: energy coupling factor transporter S component ThiW [Bacillota bacterium]|nr:energy coupling factor transporter S component ThiW [Bacillota bacterium]